VPRTYTTWRPSQTASTNAAEPSRSPATTARPRTVDRTDRPAHRPLTRHRQGLLLRPHRREGQGGQNPLPKRLPRLRRPTQPRNGKGDAYAYCKSCHPGAIAPKWTRERVRDAMRTWETRYGSWPSSYDWSRTHARRRGGDPLERLAEGDWPSPATVTDLCGT
jgi:hypothetical protein